MSGDVPANPASSASARAMSGLYVFDAERVGADSLIAARTSSIDAWPAIFDALPDHPAMSKQ
jgi:hypothetical protein